jgi:hypothetical protein
MKERPDYRAVIISGLSEFILTIPHNTIDYEDHIVSLLFKLAHLLKQWIEILQTGTDSSKSMTTTTAMSTSGVMSSFESEGFDSSMMSLPTEKIEAFALIFLCAPKKSIRLLSLDILQSLAIISKEYRFKVLKWLLSLSFFLFSSLSLSLSLRLTVFTSFF